MSDLECDYLVVGAGAVGMSFVDTMLDESDADLLIVDDRHAPGGHWNDAYPFVRLHQPSHFYGVSSTPLGTKRIDDTGSNAGYFELASGAEVQTYFENVMRQRFLPSGRVRYLPMTRYEDGRLRNTLSDVVQEVTVRRRVVDCTFFKTSVPSRHQRSYSVAEAVTCVAPNLLPRLAPDFEHFCVVGAGKTAMDAVVWLQDQGADPATISWVCPRTSWMVNRDVTQASIEFFKESVGGFAAQVKACAQATSVENLFERLEACEFMLRVDPEQRPEMFHFATISRGEVEALRRVDHIIRKGRVTAIDAEGLHLTEGDEPMPQGTLYVDCTASAVDFTRIDQQPVFEDKLITIQPVRMPNPCLSSAAIAFIECHYDDDVQRNRLCQSVRLPDDEVGYLRATLGNMMNQVAWGAEPALSEFILHSRLDGFGIVVAGADQNDPEHVEILATLKDYGQAAAANLWKLLSEEDQRASA